MRRVTEQEKAAIVERVAREVSAECWFTSPELDQVKDTLDAAGYWRLLTVARKVLCEMDRRLAIQAMINGDTNVSRTGLHAELAAVLEG